MSRFHFEDEPDGTAELAALLDDSGIPYERSGGRFQVLFSKRGRAWRTVCDCEGNRVLVYGIHPEPVTDRTAALAACSDINRQIVHGGWLSDAGADCLTHRRKAARCPDGTRDTRSGCGI